MEVERRGGGTGRDSGLEAVGTDVNQSYTPSLSLSLSLSLSPPRNGAFRVYVVVCSVSLSISPLATVEGKERIGKWRRAVKKYRLLQKRV